MRMDGDFGWVPYWTVGDVRLARRVSFLGRYFPGREFLTAAVIAIDLVEE